MFLCTHEALNKLALGFSQLAVFAFGIISSVVHLRIGYIV